jgi:hypothetical protein
MTAEPMSESRPRWGAGAWGLLLAVFAVGFVNFPLRVIGTGGEYLPGDAIDNRLNNFVLEHGYRCLASGGIVSFWHAPMFYPAPGATGWSDTHLGMLPVYALFRAVGFSPESAFLGYFLVPFILNFAATAWAVRRLGFGPVGAAAGAYIFAFGLALVAQVTHVQLFPRFLVPPAVVFAWEFLREPRSWRLAAVAACFAGQFYLTAYIAYFLALLLATGGAIAVIRFRRELPWKELLRPGRRVWMSRTKILVLAAVAVLPLGVFHALTAGKLPIEVLRSFAPRPGSWLTPADPTAALPELGEATGLAERTYGGEHQLCPGLVPLTAVAIGLFAIVRPGRFGERRSVVAVVAWSALLLGLLVTRFGEVWPYELAMKLPGTTGIRAIGRIVLVLLFPAAIATAALAESLVRGASRVGRVPAALVAVTILAVIVGEQWLTSTEGVRKSDWEPRRYSRDLTLARQARLTDAIRQHPAPRLVYVFPSAAGPGALDRVVLQLEAMRAAQDLGLPTVNGYSGYFAPGWFEFRGYRDLFVWLKDKHQTSPEVLAGLVVIGEPEPDADPQYEAAMRAAYPPRAVAPVR